MPYSGNGIHGWMSLEELVWLYGRATEVESVVEIGCWRGRSTHALLSGCRGTVYAVDHFKGNPNELQSAHIDALTHDIHAEFLANVGHFLNLVTMRMSSEEAAKYFELKSVDMIFIDGCHLKQDVASDLRLWVPICKKLLCGHDRGESGVVGALAEAGIQALQAIGSIWYCELS